MTNCKLAWERSLAGAQEEEDIGEHHPSLLQKQTDTLITKINSK